MAGRIPRIVTPLRQSSLTFRPRTSAVTISTRLAAISSPHARAFSNTPTTFANMRCVLIKDGKGPADNLYIGEEPTPVPEKGQVLVKNKTFGLNRMDILQREGKYPLPPQASKTILGVEYAGTVSQVGEGVSKFKVGDEVFGLAYGGAYAEYIAADERMVLPKPKNMSWVEGSGIPENWLTAYQALFVESNLKKGDNVLIHAGASGVGLAAIQLAVHVGGANKVFTTAGTDDKVKLLNSLGDNVHAINYRTQNYEEEIKKIDTGVDLIVDFVGRNYWTMNLNVARRDASIIYLAFLSGAGLPEGSSIAPLLAKRLTVKGSSLRSRTVEYQAKLLDGFRERALPLIEKGQMKVYVHEVFPWTEVAKAQKEMEANKNSGKIVFEITE